MQRHLRVELKKKKKKLKSPPVAQKGITFPYSSDPVPGKG